MNEKDDASNQHTDIEAMITFLKETKEGVYANVEKTSLQYSRIREETIIISDEYYYGVR